MTEVVRKQFHQPYNPYPWHEPSVVERINYIFRVWTLPCGPHTDVYIETFAPAAAIGLLVYSQIGIAEITKSKFGLTYRCGRKIKGKAQLVESVEVDSDLRRFYFRFIRPFQELFWYFSIFEGITAFLVKWHSLIFEAAGCSDPLQTHYVRLATSPGSKFPGSWQYLSLYYVDGNPDWNTVRGARVPAGNYNMAFTMSAHNPFGPLEGFQIGIWDYTDERMIHYCQPADQVDSGEDVHKIRWYTWSHGDDYAHEIGPVIRSADGYMYFDNTGLFTVADTRIGSVGPWSMNAHDVSNPRFTKAIEA